MIRIFERYTFKELIPTFLLASLFLTFVLLLKEILDLTELVVNRGLPLVGVLKLLLYFSPSSLVLVIPMAMLMGTIMAFSRLSADGEIIALKAGGIGIAHLLRPVILFALAVLVIHQAVILYFDPWGRQKFAALKLELLSQAGQLQLRPQVFNDSFNGLLIFVRDLSGRDGHMEGVLIEDSRDPEAVQTIVASRGLLVPDGQGQGMVLRLQDGTVHRLVQAKDVYQLLAFGTYDVVLRPRGTDNGGGGEPKDRVLGLEQLKNRIARLKREGKNYFPALAEFHKRFSLPVANLLFALVGVPLGIVNRRSGKAGGFALSIGIIFFYYIVTILGKGLSEDQVIHPALAMWLANGVMAVLAGVLLRRAVRETEGDWVQKISSAVQRVFKREKP